ncbi:MAG: DUF1761 domain-containing protein [Burkholderiales bacterium]
MKINWMAVFVVVVLHQALGFLWYSPMLFGDLWMDAIGLVPEDAQPTPTPFVLAIAASLALNVTLAWLFTRLYVASAMSGMWIAFICWLGFFVLNSATHSAFEGETLPLILISGGKELVAFLLSGTVLGAWAKKEERIRGIPA